MGTSIGFICLKTAQWLQCPSDLNHFRTKSVLKERSLQTFVLNSNFFIFFLLKSATFKGKYDLGCWFFLFQYFWRLKTIFSLNNYMSIELKNCPPSGRTLNFIRYFEPQKIWNASIELRAGRTLTFVFILNDSKMITKQFKWNLLEIFNINLLN